MKKYWNYFLFKEVKGRYVSGRVFEKESRRGREGDEGGKFRLEY